LRLSVQRVLGQHYAERMLNGTESGNPSAIGTRAQTLAGLLDSAEAEDFAAAGMIIEYGTPAMAAYVLIDGSAEVVDANGAVLATLVPGSLFGTDALLSGSDVTRNATVNAVGPCSVLVIGRDEFVAATVRDEALASELEADIAARSTRRQPVASPLDRLLGDGGDVPSDLSALATSFDTGDVLMAEGDPADGLYVITKGTAGVFKTMDGREIRLGDVLVGGVVGELAVLDDAPRAATIRALEPLEAVFVSRERLLADDAIDARSWFVTLRRMYEVPDRGLVTQHLCQFEGAAALRTTYELNADRHVVCHTAPDRCHVEVQDSGAPIGVEKNWSWNGDDCAVNLGVDAKNVPVFAEVNGIFPDLQLLFRCLLAALPLPASTEASLRQSGRLELDRRRLTRLDDDEICTCIGVTEVQINRVARTYEPDLEQLQNMLGCGTVCGSCIDEVDDLLEVARR